MRWISTKAVFFNSVTDEELVADMILDMTLVGHFYEELPDRTCVTNLQGDVIFTLVLDFEKFRGLYFRHIGIKMGKN